jgi:hypothetical protein
MSAVSADSMSDYLFAIEFVGNGYSSQAIRQASFEGNLGPQLFS